MLRLPVVEASSDKSVFGVELERVSGVKKVNWWMLGSWGNPLFVDEGSEVRVVMAPVWGLV